MSTDAPERIESTVDEESLLRILHTLRVRGFVSRDVLDASTESVPGEYLSSAAGRVFLTPEGLAHHDVLLDRWRAHADISSITAAYDRFLAVNQQFKSVCAGWQSRSGGSQDAAADVLYETADTLTQIVDRVRPAIERTARLVAWFDEYDSRLTTAVEAALDGDARFITDPRVDSAHSIWFECHEDYLTSLGRSREDEGSY